MPAITEESAGGRSCHLPSGPANRLAPRVIPASEFVGMGGEMVGIEEYMAATCSCCYAVDVDTRYACI